MQKIPVGQLSLWQFKNFSQQPRIRHFVTDRNSHSQENEFTLSFSSLPDKTIIEQNRAQLARAMGVDPAYLYLPSQVHKTRIVHVTKQTDKDDLLETDALITDITGVCIAVMSADCVPILLYDQKNNVVGAVHSGWRGTVARLLEKTLVEMQHRFGTRGGDVFAGIGPSVSQDVYEVGEEVINEVKENFDTHNELMIPVAPNKARLDLWKANKQQLLAFGVMPDRIEIAELCTVKNNAAFFSARKGDSGRFAAGIMIKPN